MEKVIPWDDDIHTTHADLNEAKKVVYDKLGSLLEAVPGAEPLLCFSCPSRKYFRHSIFPTYKAHRGGATKPPLLRRDLREWAEKEFESWSRPGLEADDVMGILATSSKIVKGDKVIVSPDKDLLQIPGIHLQKGKLEEVEPWQGERQLWFQVLMGDSTDGYPGCPGIGAVKAERILAEADERDETYLDHVLAAYKKAGLTFEDLVVQFNVARILTASTYNFSEKEPILWQMSMQR